MYDALRVVVLPAMSRTPYIIVNVAVSLTYFAPKQQILEHMDESGIYNESDLEPFRRRLNTLRYVFAQENGFVPCQIITRYILEILYSTMSRAGSIPKP